MNKLTSCLIILLTLFQTLCAQDSIRYSNNFEFHMVPSTIIDVMPRYRIGLEYNTSKRLGFCLDAGYGNSSWNYNALKNTNYGQDYSLFEIRSEVKYFLRQNKHYSLYCSGEAFYISMMDVFTDLYYHEKNSGTIVYFDQADFHKQKYGLHLKGGIKLKLPKRIVLDFYVGYGFAIRKIGYSNVINPVISTDPVFEEWNINGNKYIGEKAIPNFTLGFKIGVRL